MSLILYYLVFMVAGDFAAYLLGRFVEYEWGSYASLIVFLALYFLFLWVGKRKPFRNVVVNRRIKIDLRILRELVIPAIVQH